MKHWTMGKIRIHNPIYHHHHHHAVNAFFQCERVYDLFRTLYHGHDMDNIAGHCHRLVHSYGLPQVALACYRLKVSIRCFITRESSYGGTLSCDIKPLHSCYEIGNKYLLV